MEEQGVKSALNQECSFPKYQWDCKCDNYVIQQLNEQEVNIE